MYSEEKVARVNVLAALERLDNFNTENPNTMINQFFFQGKSNELIQLFSKGSPQEKTKAKEILIRIDITNASKYKDGIK